MDPYILTLKAPEEIVEEFKKIGVDAGGIEIMRHKGFLRCVKIPKVRNYFANILKQEMLSLGGDVALSRGTLTGQVKFTDCLVMGNTSQILRLTEKLKIQPFGLAQLGAGIRCSLSNFEKRDVILNVSGKNIRMGRRTLIMGIINASCDSFSGDSVAGLPPGRIKALAQDMVDRGADMLDIGGESTRPGSSKVSVKEELRRVVPILKLLRKAVRVPLSIDTTKSEVAFAALDLGANIINDVSALRFDKKMAGVAARYKASLVLMHMKGIPAKMQDNPVYGDVVGEIFSFLAEAVKKAQDAGIDNNRIIVDPGIGFGKKTEHNLEILNHLPAIKSLGRPIMVGVSRKRFIGKILKAEVSERAWGTAAAVSMSIANGADIIRVHDVKEMAQVARVADAIANRGKVNGG